MKYAENMFMVDICWNVQKDSNIWITRGLDAL